MSTTKPRGCLYIVMSFVAGLIGAGLIFAALLAFFFATGLFGWSDGGDAEYLEKLERNTNVTFPLSIILAIVTGILIVYWMNRPKRDSNTDDKVQE